MFPTRYFAARYFAPRYWPPGGLIAVITAKFKGFMTNMGRMGMK